MATLQGQKPQDTYKDLLQIANSNQGLDATLRAIQSGAGVDSCLQLSTLSAQIVQGISTSGSPTAFTITAGAHTTLTASVEAVDVNFNFARTVQFATGALTTQRAMVIQAPTYGFVGSSIITTAVTLDITGAPVAGTNATITNAYALRVGSGNALFSGSLGIGVKPSAPLHVLLTGSSGVAIPASGVAAFESSSNCFIDVLCNSTSSCGFRLDAGVNSQGYIVYDGSAGSNQLRLGAGVSDRIIISGSNGYIGVNCTAGSQLQVNSNTSTTIGLIVKGAASRSVALLNLQTSAGGTLGNVGGTIFDHFASVSSASTNGTFDVIYSDVTVANTLAVNGDKITFDYTLTVVSSATATRDFKITFGGITIFDSGALVFAATGTVRISGYIQRVTSTTCRATITFAPSGSATILGFASDNYVSDGTLTGMTLTGTNTLALTAAAAGTGAASADITGVMGFGQCLPAA